MGVAGAGSQKCHSRDLVGHSSSHARVGDPLSATQNQSWHIVPVLPRQRRRAIGQRRYGKPRRRTRPLQTVRPLAGLLKPLRESLVSLSGLLDSQELKPEAEFFPHERKIELGKNNIWPPEFLTNLKQKIGR